MTLVVAAGAVAALIFPRVLSAAEFSPLSGIAVSLLVLVLRALVVVVAVVTFTVYIPPSELFAIATHWCVHAVIPYLTTHLAFSGHQLADAAAVVPVLAMIVSVGWAALALLKATRRIHRWVRDSVLGSGPEDALLIGGSEVVLATAGVRDPKIVVSAGALASLDDDELASGLEHERGHIRRGHPYIVVVADLLFALARPLPGGRQVLTELYFYLERDADEFAVRSTGDPLALASAICKVASPGRLAGALPLSLGATGAARRLRLLLGRAPDEMPAFGAFGLIVALLVMVVGISALIPAMVLSAGGSEAHVLVCPG